MLTHYFGGLFNNKLPVANGTDITPPTFAGIASVANNTDGSIHAAWLAATDPATPITYLIYVKKTTATGLFSVVPFATTNLFLDLYRDAAGFPFLAGDVVYIGVRALDGVGNMNTNLVSLNLTATGLSYANLNSALIAIPAAVWDAIRSAHVAVGSFGESLQAKVDVDVSTRLATSTYVAPDNADITAIKAKTDHLPSDPASESSVETAINVIGNLVATRLATSSYTAPDNASVALIKAKTDNLPATPANEATVAAVKAKTDLLPASPANEVTVAAIKAKTDLLAFNGDGGVVAHTINIPAIDVQAIVDGVWNALIADHTISGTFGANAQAAAINPVQVAEAVWNALVADYDTDGTFGANAQTPAIDPTGVAQAVWNALAADYDTTGTMGNALVSGGGEAQTIIDAITALVRNLAMSVGGGAVGKIQVTNVKQKILSDVVVGKIGENS